VSQGRIPAVDLGPDLAGDPAAAPPARPIARTCEVPGFSSSPITASRRDWVSGVATALGLPANYFAEPNCTIRLIH